MTMFSLITKKISKAPLSTSFLSPSYSTVSASSHKQIFVSHIHSAFPLRIRPKNLEGPKNQAEKSLASFVLV